MIAAPRGFQPGDATLLIGVDQQLDGPQGAQLGFVATLRDITEGREPKERDSQGGLVIPIGGQGGASATVRPGRYLIEAISPSGAALDAEVEVGSGEIKDVRLQGQRSDHEWLGWQQVSGNLDRLASTVQPPARPAASRLSPTWLWLGGVFVVIGGLLGLVLAVFDLGTEAANTGLVERLNLQPPMKAAAVNLTPGPFADVLEAWPVGICGFSVIVGVFITWSLLKALIGLDWGRLSSARAQTAAAPVATATAPAAAPAPAGFVEPASHLDVLLIRAPHGAGEWDAVLAAREDARLLPGLIGAAAPTPLVPSAHDKQWRTFQILIGEAYGGPAAWCLDTTETARGGLVKLPVPWQALGQGPVPVDVLAPIDPAAAGRISATVRDPQCATMLGYLAGGRLSEAGAIVNEARGALFEKMENPYAAAGGGYVLIATADTFLDPTAEWRQWLANLDVGFPWLPDGAVLHAVSLIQTGGSGVRGKLLEAYGRGIPVYTEGLRRLRDALTFVLHDDADGKVAAAYATVNEVAARCDPQQIFTCLRLGR